MSRYTQNSPSPPSSDSGSDDENDTQYGTTDTKTTDEATDTNYIDEEDQKSESPENSGSDDENYDQENSSSDDNDDDDEPRMTRDSAGRQRFRYQNEEGGYSYTYNEWNAGDRTPSGANQSLSPHRGDDDWRRNSEEGPNWLHDEDDSD